MVSLYSIDWAELTTFEKWFTIVFFIILIISAIIAYFYEKHKEKEE
ncbi:hypothetical protein [uncultured Clostridium sp.]|nr:hypothetical protein [uncultured Clostridium sp.]